MFSLPFIDGHRRAYLMLRRGLVRSKAEVIVEETLRFCLDHDIEEVAWLCDAESFNHGITPLPIVRAYVELLHGVRQRSMEAKVGYSLNPWITLKWEDFGRDQRRVHPDFTWRVDLDGTRKQGCPCLRSPAWRDYLCNAYRLFATTQPHILWLEDDFKTFMAGGGCFCPDCLRAFHHATGEAPDRKTLLNTILAPGQPTALRAAWIDFLDDAMLETCRRLERAVHAESPETRLGIMGSWSSDGRWWQEATEILAGNTRPVARPSLAPYIEGRATEFMPDAFDIIKGMKAFGPDTEQCPELENSTYTPYAKSMRMTRLQMTLSQFLGNQSITMNLFDPVGTSIAEDPRVGAMLRRTRPLLDSLAAACGPGGTPRGVGMIWLPRIADTMPLRKGEDAGNLQSDGEGWAGPLQGAGLPVIWDAAPVMALTGRIAHGLDARAIEKMLAGGTLLDGSAAAVLQERGFGSLLGTEVVGPRGRYDQPLSAESCIDEAFAGGDGVYIDLRRYNSLNIFLELNPQKEARIISHYVDPDASPVFPATVLFENELGGRVAVHAFDLSEPPSPSFMTWKRKQQLGEIVRWLGHGSIDLRVDGGAWMVPLRRDYAKYVLIGILNFETDDWDNFQVTLAWPYPTSRPRLHLLTDTTGWNAASADRISLQEGHLALEFDRPIAALDCAALVIETGA